MDQILTLYLTISADTQGTSLYLNRNYLRSTRRKLSDLVSKNDDILKKSSNVLEITNSENAIETSTRLKSRDSRTPRRGST